MLLPAAEGNDNQSRCARIGKANRQEAETLGVRRDLGGMSFMPDSGVRIGSSGHRGLE